MLNLVNLPSVNLASMNSTISGCQTERTPIIAPLRIFPLAFLFLDFEPEPAVIISEDLSNNSMYLTAPGVSTPIP